MTSATPTTTTQTTTTKPVLLICGLSKSFGGVQALNAFDLEAKPGEVVGLIGPNGAGKTTLFNVLTGFLSADSGTIELNGQTLLRPAPHRMLSYGVARTFQGIRLVGRVSALDNVLLSFPKQAGENLLQLVFSPNEIIQAERVNTEQARDILHEVGLSHKLHDLAHNLSYGQQKLLTLACVLATGAPVLLLDEPVAGVHPKVIKRILKTIRNLAAAGKAIVLIEHNMRAMEQVATRVVFIDQGKKVAEGTAAEVLSNKRVLEAYLL